MRVHGKPEYLNLYRKHFAPLLRGIDVVAWDLELYLLAPAEMPTHNANSRRPHFAPPKTARIPIVDFDSIVYNEIYFRSQVGIIAHEIGHYIHTAYLPHNTPDDETWQQWAALSGNELELVHEAFEWRVTDYGSARHPYPHIPIFELFADHFGDWLRGRVAGRGINKFYFGLWGQEYRMKIELFIGKKFALVDGRETPLDVPPTVIGKRTMIPIRFVAEQMGLKVGWYKAEKKVTIEG